MSAATPAELTKKLHALEGLELQSAQNLEELDAWRVKYLGRKGELTELLKSLKDLSLARHQASLDAAWADKKLAHQYL